MKVEQTYTCFTHHFELFVFVRCRYMTHFTKVFNEHGEECWPVQFSDNGPVNSHAKHQLVKDGDCG